MMKNLLKKLFKKKLNLSTNIENFNKYFYNSLFSKIEQQFYFINNNGNTKELNILKFNDNQNISSNDNINNYESIRDRIANKKLKSNEEFEKERENWSKNGLFDDFDICKDTQNTLNNNGINYLFPIQQETYKFIYQKNDLIGKDRTGNGKTLAYLLPIIERLRNENKFNNKKNQTPYMIILVPTRELCVQVYKEILKLKNTNLEFRGISIYGGKNIEEQIKILYNGVEIVVGTPGRVIDLYKRKKLLLNSIETIILDETDQMLDFGFDKDMEFIINSIREEVENKPQFILFSATMPKWVKEFAVKYLDNDHKSIDLIKDSEIKTSKTVDHFSILYTNFDQKLSSISDILKIYGGTHSKSIIFTETKNEANEILLNGNLKEESMALHGDISQNQREITLKKFRNNKLKILIATNVAARGLDIPEVDLIIQMTPPTDIDSYIHRSGRTARAGKSGICITYYSEIEKSNLQKIEKASNIKFKEIGYPQPIDLIKATFEDTKTSILGIPDNISSLFDDLSDEFIKEHGEKKILTKALAFISNYKKLTKPKSLLSFNQNFKTYIFKFNNKINNLDELWSNLKSYFSVDFINSMKNIKFIKGKMSVIFEIEKDYRLEIENYLKSDNIDKFEVILPSILPELEEDLNNVSSKNFINLFINNLSLDVDRKDINSLFEKYGIRLNNLKVIFKNDKKFGFATVKKEDLKFSLKLSGTKIKDKSLRVTVSKNN